MKVIKALQLTMGLIVEEEKTVQSEDIGLQLNKKKVDASEPNNRSSARRSCHPAWRWPSLFSWTRGMKPLSPTSTLDLRAHIGQALEGRVGTNVPPDIEADIGIEAYCSWGDGFLTNVEGPEHLLLP